MTDEPRERPDRLALYREAARLSGALRTYSAASLPELNKIDAQELAECVEKYCGALEKLRGISFQIDRQDQCAESPETRAECETLRCSIRADLDDVSAFVEPCRRALQRRLSASQKDLLLVQKKKQLSAYLRSPLIGQDATHYDRRR